MQVKTTVLNTTSFSWPAGINQFSGWLFEEYQRVFERGKGSEGVARSICEDQARDLRTFGDNILMTMIR